MGKYDFPEEPDWISIQLNPDHSTLVDCVRKSQNGGSDTACDEYMDALCQSDKFKNSEYCACINAPKPFTMSECTFEPCNGAAYSYKRSANQKVFQTGGCPDFCAQIVSGDVGRDVDQYMSCGNDGDTTVNKIDLPGLRRILTMSALGMVLILTIFALVMRPKKPAPKTAAPVAAPPGPRIIRLVPKI